MNCRNCGRQIIESDYRIQYDLCVHCDKFRSDAAIAAMQGVIIWDRDDSMTFSHVADRATRHADALLAELAKPKEATNVNTDPIPSPPKMTIVEAAKVINGTPKGIRRRVWKNQNYSIRNLSEAFVIPVDILADDWEVVP